VTDEIRWVCGLAGWTGIWRGASSVAIGNAAVADSTVDGVVIVVVVVIVVLLGA
jgi:hypothetical protein